MLQEGLAGPLTVPRRCTKGLMKCLSNHPREAERSVPYPPLPLGSCRCGAGTAACHHGKAPESTNEGRISMVVRMEPTCAPRAPGCGLKSPHRRTRHFGRLGFLRGKCRRSPDIAMGPARTIAFHFRNALVSANEGCHPKFRPLGRTRIPWIWWMQQTGLVKKNPSLFKPIKARDF